MTASVGETVPAVDDFTAEWNAWHRRQEARLADPHGFLAITSLNWLTGEPQRFPDAPGEWSTGPDGVVVDLAEGEELVIGGSPVSGRHSFGVIPERGGVNAVWGDAVIEVAKRGGNDIVRPRHRTIRCAPRSGARLRTRRTRDGRSPVVTSRSPSRARRRSDPLSTGWSTSTTHPGRWNSP